VTRDNNNNNTSSLSGGVPQEEKYQGRMKSVTT
jgi:hypothetical protein